LAFRLAFLACLALLPWGWLPPFPWLHENAQWSDVFLALAAFLWLLDRRRRAALARPRPLHLALCAYLAAAAFSLLANASTAGALKLAGIASLALTAALSAELGREPESRGLLSRVVAATTLLTALLACAGVALAAIGRPTPLVGAYGDLVPGAYARAQAGLRHPNLLASFLLFAWTVVAADESMARGLRRVTLAAIWLTMPLTFSRGLLSLGVAILVARANTRRRRIVAAIGAGLVLLVLAGLTFFNLELDPTRPWSARIVPTPGARREALSTALATFAARPLTGCGPACHPSLAAGVPFDAHCTPVNLAATLGLPALLAFAALVWTLWRGRSRPASRALLGGSLALLLDGLTQDVEDFRHLWVLFGLTDAMRADAAPGTVSPPPRQTST
jgi:hypothetical protein